LTIRSIPDQGTTVEALLPDAPEKVKGAAKDD
jgi:hypothetical protein